MIYSSLTEEDKRRIEADILLAELQIRRRERRIKYHEAKPFRDIEMLNGTWTDFVTDFMSLTEGTNSPDLFRRWAGIATVAGALERRVWTKGRGVIYPNLYTLLVAPPGVGKFIIEDVRGLWNDTQEPGSRAPAFRVAPDSMSKASLMDTLAKAKGQSPLGQGPMIQYHSLLVAAEEFSVLLPAYDLEYIGVLNSIYNNKNKHEESRRHGPVRELVIENPQLNILAGVQPGWLGSVFPEEAWSTGLASRIIMVYCPDTQLQDFFYEQEDCPELHAHVLARLGHMSQLYGLMKWTPEAAGKLKDWHLNGQGPKPGHSKLAYYNNRRSVHIAKLAIVSAISRTGEKIIELVDVDRAMAWLFDAEAVMPDIFRAMIGKSDMQIIEELHYYLTTTWLKGKKEPIHERQLFGFLSQRVPSDKIEKIIQIAERSNVIQRMAGTDTYKPVPKHDFGVE